MFFRNLLMIIVSLFVILCLILFGVNYMIFTRVKANAIDFEKTIITYAATNGGFIDTEEIGFVDFYRSAEKRFHLQGKVDAVNFSHPVGERLKKGTNIQVTVKPKFELFIPFADPYSFVGKPVQRAGITKNHFRDLE